MFDYLTCYENVAQVEKLQASVCESSEKVIQLESDLNVSKEEREKVLKVLETVKENCERQVKELERENDQLSQALHTIQERCEQTNDVKVLTGVCLWCHGVSVVCQWCISVVFMVSCIVVSLWVWCHTLWWHKL